MPPSLIALALSGLGRDALKVAAVLALAVIMGLAFVVASVAALLGLASPTEIGAASQSPHMPSQIGVDGDVAAQVIRLAYAQIGKPYVWGGASPETSFDCSGLVQWVYREAGINLPRTAQQQYDATVRLSRGELQPGDAVFFRNTYYSPGEPITHVGIYIGGGQMINAPATGDVVRIMPIFTDPYWNAHYAGAGRVSRKP